MTIKKLQENKMLISQKAIQKEPFANIASPRNQEISMIDLNPPDLREMAKASCKF